MLEILFDQNLTTAVIQWAIVGGVAGALIELAHWHVSHKFRFGNIDDDSYAPRGIPGAPDQEPEHTAARSLTAVASGAAMAVWGVIMFRAPEDWRDEIELGVAALPLCALIIALLIRPRVKDVVGEPPSEEETKDLLRSDTGVIVLGLLPALFAALHLILG